jgi:phage gp45-like
MLQVEMTGPDDIQDVEWQTPAGEESSPPDGAMVFILSIGKAFKVAIACDDGFEPEISTGEKQIYSQAEGIKQAKMLLDKIGNLILTPSAIGHIELAGSSRSASGVDDKITISAETDSDFWTKFVIPLAALINAPPPTTITGVISSGTSKVKLP